MISSSGRAEIPQSLQQWLSKEKRLFIDGQWVAGAKGQTFATINPATEAALAHVSVAEKDDVDAAVRAARAAYERGEWSRLSLQDRAKLVRRLGDLILEHRRELAVLETLDTGKPIRESYEGDVPRAAMNFHFFADFALKAEMPQYENGSDLHATYREPLGVVALITPWNLPLYLETWKIAPALMMGNSIVLKPSELTPLTAIYFAELTEIAGIPKGVFNVIQGFGEKAAGEFLVSHPGIDGISFTGETGTGRAIMRSAAVGPTRVSFELGGKGASLILSDAMIEDAVSECLRAGFRNQGEICLCTPRLIIENSRYDEFVERFTRAVQTIRVGDPLDYQTTMGALIGKEHWEKVTGYLGRVESPAKILTGGTRPETLPSGYFLNPTVIEGLSWEHPISREEVFGPVVSLHRVNDEEEAILRANDTVYGLSASVWSQDNARAQRVARGLRSGLVWINCWFVRDLRVPFGGQKRSGVGREGGEHSLDFFSEWKSVCTRRGGRA